MDEQTGSPGQRPARTTDEETGFPRSFAVRLFIYLVAGHVVAFFFFLVFELGASRQ